MTQGKINTNIHRDMSVFPVSCPVPMYTHTHTQIRWLWKYHSIPVVDDHLSKLYCVHKNRHLDNQTKRKYQVLIEKMQFKQVNRIAKQQKNGKNSIIPFDNGCNNIIFFPPVTSFKKSYNSQFHRWIKSK